MKKIVNIVCFILFVITVQAQGGMSQTSQIDNVMRSNGRIFVVVAVMLIILTGLVLYLFRIDRKIGRIEREAN